ncbi:MAG: restriction endonuclease-like protein, partial [Lachnospiraceae bacterium]|nr:restriction endonuclease-like protein [Lachnospiraceae bacterium]
MGSQLIGSDELLYIKAPNVSITIKGKASHPNFEGIEYKTGDTLLKVYCMDDFEIDMKEDSTVHMSIQSGGIHSGTYSIMPMFYEQQAYEIIIEGEDGHEITFWHDNLNVRNKVTRASRNHEILSGVINFGNEVGFSDLVIKIDDSVYLRLVIEVFPTKIDYKEDYKQIVEDVTEEVYNVIFDFLKKTYLGYQQGDHIKSSPVEFFAVINSIFADFLKSTDIIMSKPHHLLQTTHEILPSHKIRRIGDRTVRWIEKHPEQAVVRNGSIAVERAMAARKQVTYDTKENRLTKYILQTTIRKLDSFRKNYMNLRRNEDQEVIGKLDGMIRELNRRCNTTFLAGVQAEETSSGMSLVFTMAPGYRDLYKYYLMLLRGLSITGDVFNISVKDLAQLYEYWCFIKLNSMMKERYELVSQDIVKVQGNGLFVSLVKGVTSRVKYRNPENGESIVLSYNPKTGQSPTVAQKPDNMLSLEKKTINSDGEKVRYEYVFDAKYRVNPALEGTDYYANISHHPGPETGDINTMHRYRDAIVYASGADPYERTMFGAYVLFPYNNEKEYRSHKFYQSIGKVNIGGLPFLPS